MAYAAEGLAQERAAYRLVILLNIVQTTRALLSMLEEDVSSNLANGSNLSTQSVSSQSDRPLSPSGREVGPRNDTEETYRRRVRLAPLLGLESQLREAIGAVTSAGSSLSAHASDASGSNEGVFKLGWRDVAPVDQDHYDTTRRNRPLSADSESSVVRGEHSRNHQREVRGRTGSLVGQRDPILAPNFAEHIGSLALGNGKKTRAQGSMKASTPILQPDGSFMATSDDPIHLFAALKTELQALWKESVSRGLIAGEGPKVEALGGYELSESARL